jgi:flavin reductase (DIM6/NTAB) family NADH-FMN oxidoreductase RutF
MSAVAKPQPEAAGMFAEYRHALGRFPTGVAFVTARAPNGEAAGLLINSFTSVSLNPPLVAWCLGIGSRSRAVFACAPSFAVSVLSEEQRSLLDALGRPLEERLNGIPVRDGLERAPVLQGAAAVFECRTFSITRAGDHDLILGSVEKFDSGPKAPLACLNGRFGRVHFPA